MTLLDAALTMHRQGLSVVPVAVDGSKRPFGNWKMFQEYPADPPMLHVWFDGHDTYDGLGIICGTVSGNLEMLEVEGRAVDLVEQLNTLMHDHDFGDLWSRLCTGYMVRSPSGGIHWLYKVDGKARGNTKLARRPGAVDGTVDVLIETRGEGGFVVTAPSAGRTHPTGHAWTTMAGSPETIPLISVAERDALHDIATLLDEMPAVEATPVVKTPAGTPLYDALRPGDDYNNRAQWVDILNPHGWQIGRRIGPGRQWTRPGKDLRDGSSATTGMHPDADRLYVFSTSTVFDTERPYSKFAAYALLEHGNDYAAAARELRRLGYGDQSPSVVGSSVATSNSGIIVVGETGEDEAPSRMRDGASFILDAPQDVPSIWGNDDECLWSVGEALMLCGPPGVGKTTITGQVVRGLLGLQEAVLGLPVAPADGRVLYLAMDRPQQIARSLRRVFGETERALLEDKVRIWEGPPPGDVAKQPGILLHLAQEAEATILIVDSMKDAAVGLTEDEVAAAYNRARQTCLANGVQVLELHHMVKRGVGGTKPNQLADVYGSAWLTAGAGSVVLIWGAAGDPIVEMVHLKQPASEVGPWRLIHDHDTGHTTIHHATDLLLMLGAAGYNGVTAKAAASVTFDKEKASRAEVEKVRRRLDKLVDQDLATREDRPNGEAGGKPTAIYRSTHTAVTEGDPFGTGHAIVTESHAEPIHAQIGLTNTLTTITDEEQTHTPPPLYQAGSVAPAATPANWVSCNDCGNPTHPGVIRAWNGYCATCKDRHPR